jgi:hypothetical protein
MATKAEPSAPIAFDHDVPYLGPPFPADAATAVPDLVNLGNTRTGVGLVLKDYHSVTLAIDADRSRSDEGKADAKQAAIPEHEKRLSYFNEICKQQEAKTDTLAAEISAALFKPSPNDPELRGWFARAPRGGPGGQVEILTTALAEDNFELIGAVCNANPAMRLISPEIREHLIAAVAEKKFPEKVKELGHRRAACEVTRLALNRARELLRGNLPQNIRDRLVVGNG